MFPKSLSSVDPTFGRHVFIHKMESIRIIIRKKIWKIRGGGQSTTMIFRGNRDGRWEHIWCVSGSFMQEGSIINGDGRYKKIWGTKISCKGIIEALINRPVVVLQC